MAKLPSFVQVTLTADRSNQINMLAAFVAHIYGEQHENRSTEELGAQIYKHSPHRSLKTWQNYIAAARAVVAAKSAALESIRVEVQTAEAMHTPIRQFIEGELRKGKFNSSPEDVSNWAKGRPSIAAADKAKKLAEQAAIREQAQIEAKNKQLATMAEQDKQTQPQQDQAPTFPDTGTETQQATLLTVTTDGEALSIDLHQAIDRTDLASIIEALQAQLDAMPVAQAEAVAA